MNLRTNTAKWLEKQGRWQIKVQKDNVRKTFTSSTPGRTGQREAHKKADLWLDNNITSTKKKVSETADEYIEQLKLTTSKSHWINYEGYFRRYINPKIGNVRIENVTEQQLQNIINEAYAKNFSKKTLTNIRSCIVSWFKFCRKSKYTTLFIEDLSIPKNAPINEKPILLPEEVRILFAEENTLLNQKSVYDLYVNAYRFQLLTGLRPGELIGLKKSDINGNVVLLQRSINTDGETTGGKNNNARRTFYLSRSAAEVLEVQYKLLDERGIESEYVFPTEHGEPVKERTYYERWEKYRKHNGIKTDMPPYGFRHTFVSMAKALPEGYLKQLVGHSKNMDTYGVYSHDFGDDKANTAAMMQNIFDGVLGRGANE
jgi:integrase